jgi:hypothetical protein
MNFKFALSQMVKIDASDEVGTVKGRAEYLNSENSYYLHYKSADGRAVKAWWEESVLSAF